MTLTFLLWMAIAQDIPAWQTAASAGKAGQKLTFDVAAIKPAKQFRPPNFSLSATNDKPPGGRLSAVFPLWVYIQFAYKFRPTPDQLRAVLAHAPKWISEGSFEIEARAEGNPTKDQMRLMMQALLADRFKLMVHLESPEIPVLEMRLAKPGKPGPNLRPHDEGAPCPLEEDAKPPGDQNVFPGQCDVEALSMREGKMILGSRRAAPDLIAEAVQSGGFIAGEVDRPVVDKTGLAGTFDFTVEWTRRPQASPGAEPPPLDPQSMSFIQALREQLGVKLIPARARIRSIVIDSVEKPTDN